MRSVHGQLSGIVLLEPEVHADSRGFFVETFSRSRHAAAGIVVDFVQDNHSRSVHGTLRGLHYQANPGQAKLIRVVRGAIWDVVVDIRPDSATFGKYAAFDLDDVVHRQVFVPVGFAHGFLVRSEVADVAYKVSTYFDPGEERGIAWDDPDVAIPWPIEAPIVSDRDQTNPRLRDVITQTVRS